MRLKQRIVIGAKVWIEQSGGFELPEGLANGSRATVVSYDAEARTVVVALDGREWTADTIHIDTGWQFLLGGRTFAEHTPRAKAFIRKMVGQLQAAADHPRFPDLRHEQISDLLKILNRNHA